MYLEIFCRDLDSVLLATTSYREGIDVLGEALSNLILHRLPFPVPDEPVTEARMERIEEDGGSSFQEYELPAAVIVFKQAFGRLIRRRTDYGISCVWISGSSHAVTAGSSCKPCRGARSCGGQEKKSWRAQLSFCGARTKMGHHRAVPFRQPSLFRSGG